jgi:peptide/bleomycin uptake transporter
MYTFFKTKQWALWAYGGGIILISLLAAQVYFALTINEWYEGFYNLFQNYKNHTVDEYYKSLLFAFKIILPYVIVIMVTNFLGRIYALRWREVTDEDMNKSWLKSTKKIEGASQRIQQDAERFTAIIEALGLEVLKGLMMLVGFLPLLWMLSKFVVIPIIGQRSGSLVLLVVLINICGLLISWFVGKKLPILEYNNQVTEAAYRKYLVFGEDIRELCKMPMLKKLFKDLRLNHEHLFLHQTYFDLWSALYMQVISFIPFVLCGGGIFTGAVSLGVMMQIVNCFGKVHESFAIILNRWKAITELRSIYMRLTEFYELMEGEQK